MPLNKLLLWLSFYEDIVAEKELCTALKKYFPKLSPSEKQRKRAVFLQLRIQRRNNWGSMVGLALREMLAKQKKKQVWNIAEYSWSWWFLQR